MSAITAEQIWEAYKPLLDLLGISPVDVYNDPPLTVSHDEDGRLVVRYYKVVDPEAPREDWPTVEVGSEPKVAELAYEVTIYPEGPDDWKQVWPEATYTAGTRA